MGHRYPDPAHGHRRDAGPATGREDGRASGPDGPLFFAAAHTFLLELTEVADVRVVILRMPRVSTIDATGAQVLGEAISRSHGRGITVLLSGITPGHSQVLDTLAAVQELRHDGLVFPDTPTAIRHARTIALGSGTRDTGEKPGTPAVHR